MVIHVLFSVLTVSRKASVDVFSLISSDTCSLRNIVYCDDLSSHRDGLSNLAFLTGVGPFSVMCTLPRCIGFSGTPLSAVRCV